MSKQFEDKLNELISERVDAILLEKTNDHDKISFLQNELQGIFIKLKEVLPEEYKDLLHKFDSMCNLKCSYEYNNLYSKGFSDGFSLATRLITDNH